MKDKIQFIVSLIVIVVILFVYEMAASGEFNLSEDNIKKLPSILIKASIFGYINVYGRNFGKKIARKSCKPFVVTIASLWTLKNKITEDKQTKAFGKHIDVLNFEKQIDMAQKKARLIIEKDNEKIAKLTRAIKVREVNKKSITSLKNKKLILETKVKEYNNLWSIKKLDKPTEALMYKLTKKYKLISQSAIFVQTPMKFERWDVTTNDKAGTTWAFLSGIISSSVLFIVISGLVLEAHRGSDWEAWISLLITLCFGAVKYWTGFEKGKQIVLHKELPTRMNALAVAQEFVDSKTPIEVKPVVVEIKEKTI